MRLLIHTNSLLLCCETLHKNKMAQAFWGLQGGTGVGGARASASNIYTMENTFLVEVYFQLLYSNSTENAYISITFTLQ